MRAARDGTAQCWGYNGYGQLGDGTTTSGTTPVAVTRPRRRRGEPGGRGEHTCAALTNGLMECWGDNGYGELGDGTTTSHVPVYVATLQNVRRVAARVGVPELVRGAVGRDDAVLGVQRQRAARRRDDGDAGAAGGRERRDERGARVRGVRARVRAALGRHGEVLGLQLERPARRRDDGAAHDAGGGERRDVAITSIAAGYAHTCATIADGTVKCWGDNGDGELGNQTDDRQLDAP